MIFIQKIEYEPLFDSKAVRIIGRLLQKLYSNGRVLFFDAESVDGNVVVALALS